MSFKDIGAKIQLAREEKGLSQEQLSKAMGCSQSALSNYEKGKRRLYLSQLEILAGILDKPMEYFVESISSGNTAADNLGKDSPGHKIVVALERLDEKQLLQVLDYINYLQWNKKGGY